MSYLTGVWASNPGQAWAVGYAAIGGSLRALILHWTGGAWQQASAADTTGTTVLTGVGGTGPGDVWAVGTAGGQPLIQHWDGTAWRAVAGPTAPGAGFTHVRARAPDDAWAVGTVVDPADHRTRPLALHWDGTAWSRVPVPDLGTANSAFTDVAEPAGGGVWFVGARDYTGGGDPGTGRPLVMRWNGTAFTDLPPAASPPGGVLSAASATGAGTMWAVGSTGNADGTRHLAVHRYGCA